MTRHPTPPHSQTTTGRPMMNAVDIALAELEASAVADPDGNGIRRYATLPTD